MAWVMEAQASQLRLYTINKREMRLAPGRLLPWSGPAYGASASRADIEERLELHRARREELAAGINTRELWDLAQGEVAQADIMWFAELLWSEPDIDQVAALGMAMLGEKAHFRFSPPWFEIFTAEQVEARLQKEAHEQKLAEVVQAGTEFFRKLYEASRAQQRIAPGEAPPEEIAADLRALLLERIADPDAHDADNIWKILTKNLSPKGGVEDAFLPLALAVSWGILPEHYNFLLDRAGYDGAADWDAPHAEACAEVWAEAGKALEQMPAVADERVFVTVDPASTRDWDDASNLRRVPGGYEWSVAVACPSLVWPFGGALDKAVLRRASSLYLPEGAHFMLPEALCRDVFSLRAGEERLMLRVSILLSEELDVRETGVSITHGRIAANISLDESEAALSGRAEMEHAQRLRDFYELSLILRQRRIDNGAVITERNDPDVALRKDENGNVLVDVTPGEDYERSHLMVGEAMILCNSELARWGRDRGIPLIYRTQVANLPRESAGVWTRPDEVNQVLKSMPPARLSLEAKPHAGVGASVYSSFTAPMRRYLDLINQAQIVSFLQNGAPRLDQAALEALLPQISARMDSAAQIQRFRTRYWKLLYLQQQEQKRKGALNYWEAIITDDVNNLVTVVLLLTGLVLRGPRGLFGDRVSVGNTVGVRVGKINPVRNEIQIMEVVDY